MSQAVPRTCSGISTGAALDVVTAKSTSLTQSYITSTRVTATIAPTCMPSTPASQVDLFYRLSLQSIRPTD